MKNLQSLANQCMHQLDAIHIPYKKPSAFEVNTRSKNRWGQCRHEADGRIVISVSEMLLQDYISDASTMDTIIHELLHTVPGCDNHGAKWKHYAEMVNSAYPQYHIKRTATPEEHGVKLDPASYKYKISCVQCGAKSYYSRCTQAVRNPSAYRCNLCGGELEVYTLVAQIKNE